MRSIKAGSARWWFENRETGEIAVAQFPNWPLFAIAAGWLAGALAPASSPVSTGSRVTVIALWVYWGTDEVLRGVNPWRKVLGGGVLAWQLVTLIRRFT